MSKELRFKITSFTPQTMPMARLAEYLKHLAVMLGSEGSVHLERIEEGSVEAVLSVDQHDMPKISERIASINAKSAPANALKASQELNALFQQDKGSGLLSGENKAVIIQFPGHSLPAPKTYGPIFEYGSLDGTPIKIGGKGDTVTVELQDIGEGRPSYSCRAKKSLAIRMKEHLFERPIRVHGRGKWLRTELGEWKLQEFLIEDFDELDDQPLEALVEKLKSIPLNGWNDIEDPLGELQRIRYGEDEAH